MNRLNESPPLKTDDGNTVILFQSTAVNPFASKEQGRVVHDKVLCAEVIGPGSSGSVSASRPIVEIEREANVLAEDGKTWTVKKIVRPWRNVDGGQISQRDRFAKQIEAYEKNQIDVDMTGTPLEQLGLEINQIADLRARGIHSCDVLAKMPDTRLLMGERALREKAKALLEMAAGMAPISRLTTENEQLRNDVDALKQQLAEALGRMDAAGIKGADVSTESKGPITKRAKAA